MIIWRNMPPRTMVDAVKAVVERKRRPSGIQPAMSTPASGAHAAPAPEPAPAAKPQGTPPQP